MGTVPKKKLHAISNQKGDALTKFQYEEGITCSIKIMFKQLIKKLMYIYNLVYAESNIININLMHINLFAKDMRKT